jgi:hypothetical protein
VRAWRVAIKLVFITGAVTRSGSPARPAAGRQAGRRCSARLELHAADRRHALAIILRARGADPARLPDLRQRRPAPARPRHAAHRGVARRACFPEAACCASTATARASAASSRARWRASAAARATSWSARNCSPRATTFPNLTLVCVLNADSALLSTDYRSAERLFATLEQVAGARAGASSPAKCWCRRDSRATPMYQALKPPRLRRLRRRAAGRARGSGLSALRVRGGAARRGHQARHRDALPSHRAALWPTRRRASTSTTRCPTS